MAVRNITEKVLSMLQASEMRFLTLLKGKTWWDILRNEELRKQIVKCLLRY